MSDAPDVAYGEPALHFHSRPALQQTDRFSRNEIPQRPLPPLPNTLQNLSLTRPRLFAPSSQMAP